MALPCIFIVNFQNRIIIGNAKCLQTIYGSAAAMKSLNVQLLFLLEMLDPLPLIKITNINRVFCIVLHFLELLFVIEL